VKSICYNIIYGQYRGKFNSISKLEININPVILSIWFMDDGSKCGNSNFYLNTQQFTKNDQEFLIKKLSILGLKARLNKDKIYYRIRFLSSSISRLKETLKENLIPSMKYKLGYNPVETCPRLTSSIGQMKIKFS